MNETHWTAEDFREYYEGYMPADEVARLETHLGTCAQCREEASGVCAEVSAEEQESAESQREQLVTALAVLAYAETSKGNAAIGARLAQWARISQAWGAVKLDVTRESAHSAMQLISEVIVPAGLEFVSAVSPSPSIAGSGAIRARGAIADGSGPWSPPINPKVELDVRRNGAELSLVLGNLPVGDGPLVVLLPAEGAGQPQFRKLESGGSHKWSARFDGIPDGKYLFLVEPPV